MRSISMRDFESTPGQLYCRRWEPDITSTRSGRSPGGSRPLSSFGAIARLDQRLRGRSGTPVTAPREDVTVAPKSPGSRPGGCMASSFPKKPPESRQDAGRLVRGGPDHAANEDRFRHMIESAPSILWSADADLRLTFANRRLVEYAGFDADSDMGEWARRLIHPDDFARCERAWCEALEGGRSLAFEVRLRRHDGAYRCFMLCIVPLKDETGRVVEWTGSAIDIDERKRSEENLR